jgi:uncharacterized protein (DUF983 family)
MLPDRGPLSLGWHCKCPKCGTGDLYKPGLTLDLRDRCETCGLDLSKNDSADGPAVFLIFILGFSLVPMALVLDAWVQLPVWVHLLIFTPLALGITVGMLRPLKAYIIALQYKHRPNDWE